VQSAGDRGWGVNVNDLQLVKADSVILRAHCLEITPEMYMPVLDPYYASIASRMVEIMRQHNALSLAAPQIGVPIRMIVIELHMHALVMVNPKIEAVYMGKMSGMEWCPNLPGASVLVPRNCCMDLLYVSRHGGTEVCTAKWLNACVVQKAIDHLNGVLITDYAKGDSE